MMLSLIYGLPTLASPGTRRKVFYHQIKDVDKTFDTQEEAIAFGFIVARIWADDQKSDWTSALGFAIVYPFFARQLTFPFGLVFCLKKAVDYPNHQSRLTLFAPGDSYRGFPAVERSVSFGADRMPVVSFFHSSFPFDRLQSFMLLIARLLFLFDLLVNPFLRLAQRELASLIFVQKSPRWTVENMHAKFTVCPPTDRRHRRILPGKVIEKYLH
jgi:hypothetical protein